MSDLIRRMDAMQACQVGPSDEWSKSTRDGYNQAATDCAMNILRVPAVQPDARIEALTAERDRLASLNVELCDNYNTLLVVRSRLQDRAEAAEADNERLLGALGRVCGFIDAGVPDMARNTAFVALTGKEPSHE